MINNSYIDFILEKEKNRKDKDNIFCTGISDREFINFAIKYLLGDDWYVIDPLAHSQIVQIALEEILKKYSKKFKKELEGYKKRRSLNMTSKEAFEKIIELCNHYQHTIEKDTEVGTIWGYPIDNIRKDLEILEIIKKSITDKYLLCKRTKCLNSLIIGLHISEDTDFKKIKEWLENE